MQFAFKEVKQVSNRISNPDKNSNSFSFALCMYIHTLFFLYNADFSICSGMYSKIVRPLQLTYDVRKRTVTISDVCSTD